MAEKGFDWIRRELDACAFASISTVDVEKYGKADRKQKDIN